MKISNLEVGFACFAIGIVCTIGVAKHHFFAQILDGRPRLKRWVEVKPGGVHPVKPTNMPMSVWKGLTPVGQFYVSEECAQLARGSAL